jgi:hypothetical protein
VHNQRLQRYLLAALPMLVVVALWGYAVRLPFYLDDVPHFTLLRDVPDLGVWWAGDAPFPFYRPVMFTVWWAAHGLTGRFDPLALHTINLFVYGLSALLIGRIARRLTESDLAGAAAGLWFAAYPFAYNAVPLVAALGHVGLVFGAALCGYFALIWNDFDAKTLRRKDKTQYKGTTTQRHKRYVALGLCWIGGFIGVFSHENGVLILPLVSLLLVAANARPPHKNPIVWFAETARALLDRRIMQLIFPLILLTATYLAVWSGIERGEGVGVRWGSLLDSWATLMQGLAYTLIALARPLFPTGDAGAAWAFAIVILTVIVMILLTLQFRKIDFLFSRSESRHGVFKSPLHRRAGENANLKRVRSAVMERGFRGEVHEGRKFHAISLLGLVWYLVSSLLPAALLDGGYVAGSPRLSLFAAVGGALMWGAFAGSLQIQRRGAEAQSKDENSQHKDTQAHRHTGLNPAPLVGLPFLNLARAFSRGRLRLQTVFLFALFALTVITAGRWWSARRSEALRLGDYTWALLAQPQSDQTLLINPPYYLAPREENRMFLRGTEGTTWMADYVSYQGLFEIHHGGAAAPVQVITFADVRRYTAEVVATPPEQLNGEALAARVRDADALYMTWIRDGLLIPVDVRATTEAQALNIRFDAGAVELLSAALRYDAGGQTAALFTTWRVNAPIDVKPFVQLFCDGVLIGQADGALWSETYPFRYWSASETQHDHRLIPLNLPDASPDCIYGLIGLYQESDGARLSALDSSGIGLPDDAVRLTP